jgi:hypothetical protein
MAYVVIKTILKIAIFAVYSPFIFTVAGTSKLDGVSTVERNLL